MWLTRVLQSQLKTTVLFYFDVSKQHGRMNANINAKPEKTITRQKLPATPPHPQKNKNATRGVQLSKHTALNRQTWGGANRKRKTPKENKCAFEVQSPSLNSKASFYPPKK